LPKKKENNGRRVPVQISRRAIHNSRGSKFYGLINSKINFHQLENFSNEIRFNENTDHSKIRIELLTNAAKDTDLIAYSTFNDMEFKIEGTIQISLVPIKKQNQLLKHYH
jgi:hypothetical protein